MHILDALQQTLVAVMNKRGDIKDGDNEAEKLLEKTIGHIAAVTKILLASPANAVQDVERAGPPNLQQAVPQAVGWGQAVEVGFLQDAPVAPYDQLLVHLEPLQDVMCNVCNIGFPSNVTLSIHKNGTKHMRSERRARSLALGPGGDA